jgi:long-chain acyl-CoA synthetase
MYLTESLHANRDARPMAAALVDDMARRSHDALFDRVARLAAALRALGVAANDRIAILALNSVAVVETFHAAWWIGAVICPVNTRWSPAEIADSLMDAGAVALIVDATHAPSIEALRGSLPALRIVIRIDAGADADACRFEALIAAHPPAEDGRFKDAHHAALLYTGGTTGRAKGVLLSHRNLVAAARCRIAENGLDADGVCLVTTPLFHVAGLVRVVSHLAAGGCCVLPAQFRPADVLQRIEREGVTDAGLVPSMLQMVLDDPAFSADRLRPIRRLGYGAAPSARALLERLQNIAPWIGLYQSYGMTESCAIGTLSRPEDHRPDGWADGRATSAGRPSRNTDVRVVDALDRDVPEGQPGEILLRGPTVMLGYWNRPEETAAALQGGWLHTGDIGTLRADGYLKVVDRLKDMIITGGENVYSAEVENALQSHPAIAHCGVIGVFDARWGEAVHAIVTLRPGMHVDEADLRRHCASLLGNYKRPKSFAFLDVMPLTAAGKINKQELRSRFDPRRARMP